MKQGCQFREVQHWARVLTWPVTTAVFLVPVLLFAQFESIFRIVLQAMAITCIPLTWLLLEWMGPTVEVSQGVLSYSIWPFYLKEFDLAGVKSCKAKTFHPPGNDVQWRRWTSKVEDTHYVELWLNDGRVIDLTTDHPERLADAIRRESELAKRGYRRTEEQFV